MTTLALLSETATVALVSLRLHFLMIVLSDPSLKGSCSVVMIGTFALLPAAKA